MLRRLLWLLVPLTLVAGVAAGLYLAWEPLAGAPVAAEPSQLRRSEKEQFIRLVASAFAEEQDVRRARTRLEWLEAGNAPLWVAELARDEARQGRQASAARLARLALALGISDPQLLELAATPTP